MCDAPRGPRLRQASSFSALTETAGKSVKKEVSEKQPHPRKNKPARMGHPEVLSESKARLAASKWYTCSSQMRWYSGISVLHSVPKYTAPGANGEDDLHFRFFTVVSIAQRRGAGGSVGLIPVWATTHGRRVNHTQGH